MENLVVLILMGLCGAVIIGTYVICSVVFKIKDYCYEKKKAQFYKDNPQAKEMDNQINITYREEHRLSTRRSELKKIIITYYQEERVYLTRAMKRQKDHEMEMLKAELEVVEREYFIALKNYRNAWNNRQALGGYY